jgi:hypothetical protein
MDIPTYSNPSMRPSPQQESRPMIGTTVDSNVRASFDRDFMLNELYSLPLSPRETALLDLFAHLARPIRGKNGNMNKMSDNQMHIAEQYLDALFYNVEDVSAPKSGAIRCALTALVVKVRFGY